MLIQNVTTTTGASYVVDFWLAAGHGFAVFSILWGGSFIFTQDFFDESFDYTEHKFALTASSATTELEFRSSILDGVILLDDVSVTPVGVPDTGSTVSLLGSALLGLATLRRKLS